MGKSKAPKKSSAEKEAEKYQQQLIEQQQRELEEQRLKYAQLQESLTKEFGDQKNELQTSLLNQLQTQKLAVQSQLDAANDLAQRYSQQSSLLGNELMQSQNQLNLLFNKFQTESGQFADQTNQAVSSLQTGLNDLYSQQQARTGEAQQATADSDAAAQAQSQNLQNQQLGAQMQMDDAQQDLQRPLLSNLENQLERQTVQRQQRQARGFARTSGRALPDDALGEQSSQRRGLSLLQQQQLEDQFARLTQDPEAEAASSGQSALEGQVSDTVEGLLSSTGTVNAPDMDTPEGAGQLQQLQDMALQRQAEMEKLRAQEQQKFEAELRRIEREEEQRRKQMEAERRRREQELQQRRQAQASAQQQQKPSLMNIKRRRAFMQSSPNDRKEFKRKLFREGGQDAWISFLKGLR